MGFILFFIAKLLSFFLFPIGWVYSLITFRLEIKKLDVYAKKIAISIDQTGNVVMANFFNDILIKKDGYKFGNENLTISSVLAVNHDNKKLTFIGLFLSKLLEYLDNGHLKKSLENEIKNV